MVQKPIIGIVVPMYNAEKYLPATLDSILQQTFTDWECVLVNDGSPDKSVEIAQAYIERDDRFRVVSKENGGMGSARNFGYKELSPSVQYLSFMDSDDVWLPDALETLRGDMDETPELVGAHGLADMIDGVGAPFHPGVLAMYERTRIGFDGKRMAHVDPSLPTSFAVLMWASRIYPPGLMLIRRTAFDKVGSWDETLKVVADHDMWLRLSRHGNFKFIDRIVVHYRRHGMNITDEQMRTIIEIRQLHYKTFFSAENTEEHRRLLRSGWKAWQISKIQDKWKEGMQDLANRKLRDSVRKIGSIPIHVFRNILGRPDNLTLRLKM
jgi:glycosyltransferase involved in cell wall biosynthesis